MDISSSSSSSPSNSAAASASSRVASIYESFSSGMQSLDYLSNNSKTFDDCLANLYAQVEDFFVTYIVGGLVVDDRSNSPVEVIWRRCFLKTINSDLFLKNFESNERNPGVKFIMKSIEFVTRTIEIKDEDFCKKNLIPAIPFLMIEDFLKCMPLTHSESCWTLIENMIKGLSEKFFDIIQYILLRTCNALLRRLSRTNNAEFCGRINNLLSNICPLEHKSAQNQGGSINTSNATEYDKEAVFKASIDEFKQSRKEHMELLETADDSIVGTMDVAGDDKALNNSNSEEGEVEEDVFLSALKRCEDQEVVIKYMNFGFYNTLWGLQEFFSEFKLIDNISKWKAFVESVKQILIAFESNEILNGVNGSVNPNVNINDPNVIEESVKSLYSSMSRKHNQKQKELFAHIRKTGFNYDSYESSNNSGDNNEKMKMKTENEESNSASSSAYGCKFLTSSKLLGLQLNDPSFKKQVCSQIIFFVHSFRFKGPVFLTSAQPANQKVSAKSQTTKDMAVAANLMAAEKASVLQDFESIEKRAFRLIDCTSNGIMFSRILRRILSREVRMIAWKNEKCPTYGRKRPIDSVNNESDSGSSGISSSDISKSKREKIIPLSWEVGSDFNNFSSKIMHPRIIQKNKSSFSSSVYDDKFEEQECSFDCSTENVIIYAQNLVDRVPDFEQHTSYYLDAEEDPDLEPEYHPKKNPSYIWRGLRLIAQTNIGVFEAMPDGDFAKGLIHLGLLKEKVGEEEEDVDVDDDDDDDDNEEEGKKIDLEMVVLDNASSNENVEGKADDAGVKHENDAVDVDENESRGDMNIENEGNDENRDGNNEAVIDNDGCEEKDNE